MKVACLSVLSIALLSGVSAFAAAADRGTPAEAKAMLAKAVAHYKEAGRSQALADFNAKKPPFGDRDLYVACIGADHKIIANGGFPQYVGVSADLWRDASGKSIGAQGWQAVQATGSGEVKYQWLNPLSHKLEPKITFFAKAGADVCGVGAYNLG